MKSHKQNRDLQTKGSRVARPQRDHGTLGKSQPGQLCNLQAEVNMETALNPFKTRLAQELEEQAYKVLGLLGRKLFESGHYAYAQASSIAGLPVAEAQSFFPLDQISSDLPMGFWHKLRGLLCLTYTRELIALLESDFVGLLEKIAKQDLNRIRSKPTFSEVGFAIKSGLDHDLSALSHSLGDCRSLLEGLYEKWEAKLNAALLLSKIAPQKLTELFEEQDKGVLDQVCAALTLRAECLANWQIQFHFCLQESHRPILVSATHRDLLERIRAFEAHRVQSFLTRPSLFREAQWNESEAEKKCDLLLTDIYLGLQLLQLTKEEHNQISLTLGESLQSENDSYTAALKNQLQEMGVAAPTAQALRQQLFAYCQEHATRAIDVLDDELQKLSPTVPKDLIAAARLKVRMEDLSFPLSVRFRESVEKAFRN